MSVDGAIESQVARGKAAGNQQDRGDFPANGRLKAVAWPAHTWFIALLMLYSSKIGLKISGEISGFSPGQPQRLDAKNNAS
jgi:hypothetical protein